MCFGYYITCLCTTERTCEEIEVPANATVRYNNNEYQRRVRYECPIGVFPGGKDFHVMECDNNAQWKSEPAPSGCHSRLSQLMYII